MTTAARLGALAAAGVSGACLVFPDFAADLPRFIRHVIPLLANRGSPPA